MRVLLLLFACLIAAGFGCESELLFRATTAEGDLVGINEHGELQVGRTVRVFGCPARRAQILQDLRCAMELSNRMTDTDADAHEPYFEYKYRVASKGTVIVTTIRHDHQTWRRFIQSETDVRACHDFRRDA